MKFLSILLFFGGYTFVYAAVANRGLLATEPWLGLFTDAYATNAIQQGEQNEGNIASGNTPPSKLPRNRLSPNPPGILPGENLPPLSKTFP